MRSDGIPQLTEISPKIKGRGVRLVDITLGARWTLFEGGARLGSGEVSDLSIQAELLAASWTRMSAARGIEMFSNYLMYADPVANSGLCEADGTPRPVWDVFRRFPSFA